MSQKGDIKEAIKNIARTDDEMYSVLCRVDTIDLAKRKCYCIPVDGSADITDVDLVLDVKKGFYLQPKIGSLVYVKMKNKSAGYVSMVSEVDEIWLNGDNFGGLIKIDELVKQMNNLEKFANNVIASNVAIQAAGVSSPTTPVTNATLAAFLTAIGQVPLAVTTKLQLENTTVKHGTGI